MGKIISCDDIEAEIMASIDREVLDYLPTDQKYNGGMEEVLYQEYGYGFVDEKKQKTYNIPDYISDEDIANWEAESFLYEASIIDSYPEAKEYILKNKR